MSPFHLHAWLLTLCFFNYSFVAWMVAVVDLSRRASCGNGDIQSGSDVQGVWNVASVTKELCHSFCFNFP